MMMSRYVNGYYCLLTELGLENGSMNIVGLKDIMLIAFT